MQLLHTHWKQRGSDCIICFHLCCCSAPGLGDQLGQWKRNRLGREEKQADHDLYQGNNGKRKSKYRLHFKFKFYQRSKHFLLPGTVVCTFCTVNRVSPQRWCGIARIEERYIDLIICCSGCYGIVRALVFAPCQVLPQPWYNDVELQRHR